MRKVEDAMSRVYFLHQYETSTLIKKKKTPALVLYEAETTASPTLILR